MEWKVPVQLLQSIVNYLQERPYKEVGALVNALAQLAAANKPLETSEPQEVEPQAEKEIPVDAPVQN